MKPKYLIFTVTTVLVVLADQLTKWWVHRSLRLGVDAIDVIPGLFQIVHVQNTGAAFGLMRDTPYRMAIFLVFTVVAAVAILWQLRHTEDRQRFLPAILGLIMAGAIGNAIDRGIKASVTDFLRFYTEHPRLKPWLIEHFGMAEWPSFNVADMAIVIGVILFFVYFTFFEDEGGEDEAARAAEELAATPRS